MNRLSINFEDLLARYRKHENDTGSSECQVILLTQRINTLSSQHIPGNHKDHPASRSLVRMVAARHRHQRYLSRIYKHNPELIKSYKTLLGELGLRR